MPNLGDTGNLDAGNTGFRPHTQPPIIDGQIIPAGESREIHLRFSETYIGNPVTLPLFVRCATIEGPRIFFTGVIHGDELNGMGIVREFIHNHLAYLKQGTVICAPLVNIFGLERHTRYMPDRRDLNRSFPGAPDGSLTGRLAHALFTHVVSQCDGGVDFHSAAVRRTNYPNVRADISNPAARRLAQAFGCEIIVNGEGPKNSLRRTATEHGIPTIILEAGEVWKIEPAIVEIGVRGCANVLRELGMLDGEHEAPAFQVTVEEAIWVRAELGGILGFLVQPGDLVTRGQELATCQSILGKERSHVYAPADGIILGVTTMPAVKPGEPIYHLAVLGEREFDMAKNGIAARSRSGVFARVREDLGTNITLQNGS